MTKLSEFAAGAPSTGTKWVGQSILRHEDPRLLTGRGCFVDDITLPNLHHAAILRSPHAHARIKLIAMGRDQFDVAVRQPSSQRVAIVALVGNHSLRLLTRPPRSACFLCKSPVQD